ncbi:DUF2637 domain-containing protein [Streptomyces sp. NPDC002698]|uniref:DUF2637 domain-containing protein n=1 Tax=Streptomyces sp. NPDC002698 TaxID=3364660 RepID=UPI003674F556
MKRRHVVITGAVIVAVTAFTASADTLASLGQAVGWKGRLSWSLPVAVDVLALVALVAWFTPGVRKLGQWMTAGSVVTSVILNALGHLVETGHLTVGSKMVIAVSAVPVISMALAAHLAVEVTRPEEDAPAVTTADDRPSYAVQEAAQEVTTEVTAPVQEVTAPDDHMTAPVPVLAAASDRLVVTEKVTEEPVTEVTATIRKAAEELTAGQGGRVTIDQLRGLGLSRRTATSLRRELVTEGAQS